LIGGLSAFALCHLEDGAFWQCAGFVRFCSAFVPRSDKQRWPGEKLFEELLIGDGPQGTAHPRIMMAREVCMTWPELADTVEQLQHASQAFDCEDVLTILKTAPTGFAPNGGVGDLVWNLNPRPLVADKADKGGTDLKSVPRRKLK